jgi:hypothetical protein
VCLNATADAESLAAPAALSRFVHTDSTDEFAPAAASGLEAGVVSLVPHKCSTRASCTGAGCFDASARDAMLTQLVLRAASSGLRILPVGLRGSSSRNMTPCGDLVAREVVLHGRLELRGSDQSAPPPDGECAETLAVDADAAASAIAGWVIRSSSTSRGKMFSRTVGGVSRASVVALAPAGSRSSAIPAPSACAPQ